MIKEEISDLLQEIKSFLIGELKENISKAQSPIKYYWEASRRADKIIQTVLGETVRFPVDIKLLAEKMGVQVEEDDLNEFSSWKCMNRKIGQLEIGENSFSSRKVRAIFVDKKAPPSSQRYAIAHELVHYIIHYSDRDYYEAYCTMPMCPEDIEEVVADIFAIFLLIPVRYFFVEFLEYVKRKTDEGKIPVTTESWIRYLAERSMISDYYVAYGYQQLRYVAYWIYQAWSDESTLGTIGTNQNVMADEDRKQIREETKNYYTEEMGEVLFE
ncbi:ImmA/IrrE family metallo-endopeptidase [Anaerotruncus sp. 1XD22-93]|nr:ImmA/IrrE family metallo-endopeptidase [Lachnospiraceae bacterium]NBI76980.1 ImmA/IrrE family metallo-endopeptidase [Lachnospiraceae bacterium]RKK00305.1 ImmA/IrrE family metallo-endopeptidase [Anaerotruncus sp. 1XD22-93]